MTTGSKRTTKSKMLEQDRLSSLPDDTLTHILSFLTTKQSVSTSILSTRWKHLFKSVPVLHFDSSERQNEFLDEYIDFSFHRFVNKVLAVHNVKCIQSFRLLLHCPNMHLCCKSLDSWISDAISRDPQLLEMNIARRWYLPDDIFTCRGLVHLKLTGQFELRVIDNVCLPALKTFYISYSIIEDGDSVRALISNCPVLEDLTLDVHYSNVDAKFLSINVPSLKRLTISCYWYYSQPCVWELNVPNLEYVNCYGDASKWYSVTVLNSLCEAYIGLEDPYGKIHWPDDDRLWELINKFDEVQFLSLSGDSMQSLASDSVSLPVFNKLTTLELKAKYCKGWKIFPTLLTKTPSLAVLVIHGDGFLDSNQMFPEIKVLLPKQVPLCFSRSLKEFKLCKFGGDKVEYEWMEYLLKNAKVLEKLTITVQTRPLEDYFAYLERLSEIEKQLLALPRDSKTCEIMVREANGGTKCQGNGRLGTCP